MTVQVENGGQALRLALAAKLADDGALHDKRWRDAVEEVPRHLFVPAYWRLGPDGQPHRVERDDPDWMVGAYEDAALTVQMTDGVATSSSTAPSLMLRMLEALHVDDDALVLEIGTGTGYNTALLCHRLASQQVVTVEVDPKLAGAAEARLNLLGWHPAVRVEDGVLGAVGTRRFDALIATCGMSDVPAAWLTQTRPGAVLVVPVGTGVVRLVRDEDGTAGGRFEPWPAFFMAARDAGTSGAVPYPGEPDVTQDRPTSLAPHDASDDDFAFVCSLLLPHTGWGRTFGPDGQVASVRLWDLERYALNRHDLMDGGPRELTRPCCGCCRSGRRADGRGEPLMASPNNPHPGAGAYSNAAEIAAQLQGRAAAVLPSAVSVVRHCAMLLETQIKANASGRPGPNAPTGDYRRSWTHEVHTGADAVLAIVGTSKP